MSCHIDYRMLHGFFPEGLEFPHKIYEVLPGKWHSSRDEA